jgi:hypothetical protein
MGLAGSATLSPVLLIMLVKVCGVGIVKRPGRLDASCPELLLAIEFEATDSAVKVAGLVIVGHHRVRTRNKRVVALHIPVSLPLDLIAPLRKSPTCARRAFDKVLR